MYEFPGILSSWNSLAVGSRHEVRVGEWHRVRVVRAIRAGRIHSQRVTATVRIA